MMEEGLDPREELLEIAASVRALLGLYEATGASGLPPAERVVEAPVAFVPQVAPPQQVHEQRRSPVAANVFQAPTFGAPNPTQTPRPPAASLQTNPAPVQARPAVALGLTPEARVDKLRVIAEEVASCTRCGLCETRTNTVFSRGNPLAELCFVGEGPGEEEDLSGEPFVGEAGRLLDRMITAMGYQRDEVYICNIVKCRPPKNRKPEPGEMAACKPFLVRQIELVRPKYIVALGATATQGLLGTSEGIMRLRGEWKSYRGIPMMPTYHPAYLLRQPPDKPEAKRLVWNDLQKVMARLGKTPQGRST